MELNEFHDFPPMYTIQPAEITREKQLRLWSELILKYYSSKGESVMIPGSFEHFTNPKIDRSLSEDGRLLVCDFMVNHGNAEWIDIKQKSRLRLIFKSVEVLASEIFKYADEIGLKNHISDRTNWRKMLQNNLVDDDLYEVREKLIPYIDSELIQYVKKTETISQIKFPVIKYPKKVKSVGLDKHPYIEEKLVGIKGQYLLFDNDTVFNMRKHTGYLIELSY